MLHLIDRDNLHRAEHIWKTLQAIFIANKSAPLIVEGRKDKEALRILGFTGEIILLNSGKGYYDFCEDIKDKYDEVILLTDWDAKGNDIFKKLSENLSGISEKHGFLRERLMYLCQKDIADVQGIPSLIFRLIGQYVKVGDELYGFNDAIKSDV